MNVKQQLLLYLIANYPFLRGIFQLVKTFDRADFPSNISSNLESLLQDGLIVVDELFDNKTPASYIATNKGLIYLYNEVKIESLILYVNTFDYPDQLLMTLKVDDNTEQRTT
jgi:hypothetical protein